MDDTKLLTSTRHSDKHQASGISADRRKDAEDRQGICHTVLSTPSMALHGHGPPASCSGAHQHPGASSSSGLHVPVLISHRVNKMFFLMSVNVSNFKSIPCHPQSVFSLYKYVKTVYSSSLWVNQFSVPKLQISWCNFSPRVSGEKKAAWRNVSKQRWI